MAVNAIDLGDVRGPMGPAGPSGIAVTSGAPDPSEGSDGELRVDPSTGVFWLKDDGAWTNAMTAIIAQSQTTVLPFSGGTGTYASGHQVNLYGPLGFLSLGGNNQDESVWKMSVVVGPAATATKIVTIPAGMRPGKTDYLIGRLYTANKVYHATFVVSSDTGSYPGDVFIDAVYDDDFNRVRDSGGNLVTQFDATCFSLHAVYRIMGS